MNFNPENPREVTHLNISEFEALKAHVQRDPTYAWKFHNTLIDCIMHRTSLNAIAATPIVGGIMNDLFGVNTASPSFSDRVNESFVKEWKSANP